LGEHLQTKRILIQRKGTDSSIIINKKAVIRRGSNDRFFVIIKMFQIFEIYSIPKKGLLLQVLIFNYLDMIFNVISMLKTLKFPFFDSNFSGFNSKSGITLSNKPFLGPL